MNTRKFDQNNYEFNKKSPIGIYLIHGFSNTTYEVKQLADFLAKNNYHVIANNLPGHGTTVEECNRVKHTDWITAVTQDVAKLASESEKVYVIGCSMGGVLALYLSSIFPLNGCIVGGTVLKFKNSFTVNYLNTIICKILKISKKKDTSKNTLPVTFYGYSAYPLIALNEFKKLNKIVRQRMSKIKNPTFIIHSNIDRLSTDENITIIQNSIKSENPELLIVERAHHNLFDKNPDQELIFARILKFINQ